MWDPDEVSQALANALKRHRQRFGLTQAEVASAARLPATKTYQRLERHERPCSVPQLVGVANAFELTPHELLRAAEYERTADRLAEPSPRLEPVLVSRGVAAEFRQRRERLGLSQAEVAATAGFRWTIIYQRLEYHERRAVIPQVVAVANALKSPPHEVLHAAELRAVTGNLPRHRTGLRQ